VSRPSYHQSRRAFLRRVGCASACAGLSSWLLQMEGYAQGVPAAKRLLLMTRPNGTIRSEWLPQGSATVFTLPSISSAFEKLRSDMLILDGVDLKLSGVGSPTHEAGMVTLLTGGPTGPARPAPNDFKNLLPSVDQHLCSVSPSLKSHKPLYVVADGRVDNSKPQVANRAAAYLGADQPIFPELQPLLVYKRLFGAFMPGGATPENLAELERARQEQRSVLDFVMTDLKSLQQLAPSEARPQLEQHAEVIRELEKTLDSTAPKPNASCAVPATPMELQTNVDRNLGAVAAQHLSVLRAALACDLVRFSTFMWTAAASSAVWRDLYSGMGPENHHALSHEDLRNATVMKGLAAIDHWFAQQTALFLESLKTIQEADGTSLLDNTLIVYTSECADGDHSPDNMPIALFGGGSLGVQNGQFLKYDSRSFNDLWLSIAEAFGAPLTSLGAAGQSSGPLRGIFG
jgi:hypothetical protein